MLVSDLRKVMLSYDKVRIIDDNIGCLFEGNFIECDYDYNLSDKEVIQIFSNINSEYITICIE